MLNAELWIVQGMKYRYDFIFRKNLTVAVLKMNNTENCWAGFHRRSARNDSCRSSVRADVCFASHDHLKKDMPRSS